tara:strand:+ start:6125 stop:6673 length:549 start_codon:yes stop_codon:yes gene_type:complete
MQLKETQKALDIFKQYVLNQSRSILSNKKKNVTGTLFNSLEGKVKAMPNSLTASFTMEDYGYYVDRGVKGKTSTYSEIGQYGTLAKFGSGKGKSKGLRKGIKEWVKNRRFQFRDKKTGKFLSYKSTAFLITRSIWNKGIKPSLFFTKPFERAFEQLPKELTKTFALDMDSFLEFTLNQDRKK